VVAKLSESAALSAPEELSGGRACIALRTNGQTHDVRCRRGALAGRLQAAWIFVKHTRILLSLRDRTKRCSHWVGGSKLLYSFENFSFDSDRRELYCGSELRPLEPQVFDVLEYLLRNRGRVVTKDELVDAIWNGRAVSDATVASRIKSARAAIDDDGANQRLIRTLLRKGFLFSGAVRERLDAAPTGVGDQAKAIAMPLPGRPSVAVLPFTNLSGDPEQEYFADGVVEDITTALSRFRHLFVIARNSSFTYKARTVDIKTVGRELGVRYVLEGSVRQTQGRVRINGQLIDAASNAHLWADQFDGTLDDIFGLQDRVTASVVGAIAPTLESAEIERTGRKPTESLDAYDHYLRGVAVSYQMTRGACDDALRFFAKANELDPSFAAPFARAALIYTVRKANSWMTDRAQETADATHMARKAITLGRDDAAALSYGGYALAYVAGDLEAGDAYVDLALNLNGNLANAWGASGWMKTCLGDYDIGIKRAEFALRLSPLDPRKFAWQFSIALANLLAGRFDQAVEWATRSRHQQSTWLAPLRVTAASHALAGRLDDARRVVTRLRELDPGVRLSTLRDVLPPIRKPEDLAIYIEGLRMAGIPA
jgi:TolB-like protein